MQSKTVEEKEKGTQSMLWNFVELESDKLVTTGRYTGYHEWYYKCKIEFGGCVCGTHTLSRFVLRKAERLTQATSRVT